MDTLELVFRILAWCVNILAKLPQACETISKGWNLVTKFLRSLDGYEKGETSPPPVRMNTTIVPLTGVMYLNVCDGIPLGMNDGYPALRLRQNTAAYYPQGSN